MNITKDQVIVNKEELKFLVEGLAFLGREMHLIHAELKGDKTKVNGLGYHGLQRGLDIIATNSMDSEDIKEALNEIRTTYLESKEPWKRREQVKDI